MYLSIIEFPANFEYGVDVNSSVECLKMLEVPSHYVYNFNSVYTNLSVTNKQTPRIDITTLNLNLGCHILKLMIIHDILK